MKKWVLAFCVALIASVSLAMPVHQLRIQYSEQAAQEQRLQVRDHANFVRDDIQTKLDSQLFYADFFEMIIRQNPSMGDNDLREYARLIVERNETVDNISLARDGVVNFVYPERGNEAVIGLNLMEQPNYQETLDYATTYRTAVTQGPVESIQGGLKLFNRKPIYTESISAEELWGFATVTVDFQELLEQTQLTNEEDEYIYGIRIDSTINESIEWGDTSIFEKDALVQTIQLHESSWSIGVLPINGWTTEGKHYSQEMIIFYLLIAIIFVVVFSFVNHYANKREQSRLDSLTGILNKRTFEAVSKRIIKYSTQVNGLIMIDFNDFKKINDKHGHLFGDKVLKETARRMKAIVKQSDKVGRIGGDEFMIIVRDIGSENNLEKVAERIINRVQEPIEFNGERIRPSISIGYALTDSTDVFETIYDVVDKKMYDHKEDFKLAQDDYLI